MLHNESDALTQFQERAAWLRVYFFSSAFYYALDDSFEGEGHFHLKKGTHPASHNNITHAAILKSNIFTVRVFRGKSGHTHIFINFDGTLAHRRSNMLALSALAVHVCV
jgi:hypothetical protein